MKNLEHLHFSLLLLLLCKKSPSERIVGKSSSSSSTTKFEIKCVTGVRKHFQFFNVQERIKSIFTAKIFFYNSHEPPPSLFFFWPETTINITVRNHQETNICSVLKFSTQFYGKNNIILVLQLDKQGAMIQQLLLYTRKSANKWNYIYLLFSYYQKFQAARTNPGMNINASGERMDMTTSCAVRRAIQRHVDVHTWVC